MNFDHSNWMDAKSNFNVRKYNWENNLLFRLTISLRDFKLIEIGDKQICFNIQFHSFYMILTNFEIDKLLLNIFPKLINFVWKHLFMDDYCCWKTTFCSRGFANDDLFFGKNERKRWIMKKSFCVHHSLQVINANLFCCCCKICRKLILSSKASKLCLANIVKILVSTKTGNIEWTLWHFSSSLINPICSFEVIPFFHSNFVKENGEIKKKTEMRSLWKKQFV